MSEKLAVQLDSALGEVEKQFLIPYTSGDVAPGDSTALFMVLEKAWWYYEDNYSDLNSNLPHFSSLDSFAWTIISRNAVFSSLKTDFPKLVAKFKAYRASRPVCGCILMDPPMKKVVLVRSWRDKSWQFPRGKLEGDERHFQCALREVCHMSPSLWLFQNT
jgi:Dcp2, box A domain/NUDIX domain